jgi:octaprenyl-diphosphate synthase
VAIVVPLDGGKRGKDAAGPLPTLDRIQALIAEDLKQVNELILQRMQSRVALIPQLAGHIVAAGGKRLRPILTLASAKLCGYEGRRHVKLATCVEFIHTATLLHDDVVDESDLRRGLKTANAVWGNKPSVLVGDFLFSRAFQVMVEDGSMEVLRILSGASAEIAEGEVHQLITANDTETSENAYLEVVKAKTAVLFAAACRVGAVVAEQSSAGEEALESYGMNLGIAFQLIDDVLDYSAEQAQLGKSVGDDFRDGKITLPVILAYRRGTDKERAFWRRTLEEQTQDVADLDKAIELLRKHRALDDTADRARHYCAVARDALGIFPDNEAKVALLDVLEFAIARAH